VKPYFVHHSPDGVLRQRINVKLYPRLLDSCNEGLVGGVLNRESATQ
jgi:hypothetical protein